MLDVRINKRNNLLAIIPNLWESYSVKFEFKPTRFQSGWTNIIHLTATGSNCCAIGDRIPAVWFGRESATASKNGLHVCSAVNDEGKQEGSVERHTTNNHKYRKMMTRT